MDRYFIHLREKPTNRVKGLTLRFSSVTPVEQTHSPHDFTASSYNWRFVGPTTSLERYENKAVSVGGIFITGEYVFLAHASDNWSQLKKYRGWAWGGVLISGQFFDMIETRIARKRTDPTQSCPMSLLTLICIWMNE